MNISLSTDDFDNEHNKTTDEVVAEALQKLKLREELRQKIQVGIDQLDRGEGTEYDENSLQRFIDDIKTTEEKMYGQEPDKS